MCVRAAGLAPCAVVLEEANRSGRMSASTAIQGPELINGDQRKAMDEEIGYTIADLQRVMRVHYDIIIYFVTSPEFLCLMEELKSLPAADRPTYVRDVLLSDTALMTRGIKVPSGVLIQRSAFGDRRPTLFAVKHFLPDGYRNVWENVNLTFDNEYLDSNVSREREICWRAPIEPAQQAQAMVDGVALEVV